MALINLELYNPHPLQLKFHESKARYRVFAAGRQVGKSTMVNNELAFRAWENPKQKFWFISPIYAQAKDQFRRLLQALPRQVIERTSETELNIEFINGSIIEYKSGETLDRLRGATLNGVVIDEMRDQHRDLWPLVIRPMLTTTTGWAAFVSTPMGFDSFYDLAQSAKKDTKGNWEFFCGPSTANPLFTKEEFDAARSEMSEPIFAQEILAEFRDITAGRAYTNYGVHNQLLHSPFTRDGSIVAPHLPILLSPDFNLNPMAWEIGQQRNEDFYYFDEVFLPNSNTQEASKELVYKLRAYRDEGLIRAKPNIVVCGDATSKSGQRAAAGKSDYDILLAALKEAEFTFDNRTPDSNPHVKDRVNNFNTKCRAADNSIHFWLNPARNPFLHKDLTRVVWKPGASFTLDQTTDPERTHASDGPGYSMHALSPIPDIRPVGKLRVILR